MNFEDQLKVLVYFHLQAHKSGRHLLQKLEEDDFARAIITPKVLMEPIFNRVIIFSRYLSSFDLPGPFGRLNLTPAAFLALKASLVLWLIKSRSISAAMAKTILIIYDSIELLSV